MNSIHTSLFSNLRVLELASVLAAPAVGMFFAELGATVIKVENARTGGDVTRSWKSNREAPDAAVSAYYASVNWGKQTHLLDLSLPSVQEWIYEIALGADVILANFKPSSAEKLGMDYKVFQRLNPRVIYANLTGFGEDEDRAAFDVVLQAESGFMFMNGQADAPPTKMPVALIDVLASHQLKEGILCALLRRQQSGEGSYVSVSLLDSALASLANQATNYLMAGLVPQRVGSLHPNIAPYGEIFTTSDGEQLVLAIGNDKQFRTLCEALGVPLLADDVRFTTNVLRVEHRPALTEALQRAFATCSAATVLPFCHSHYVPIGQIRNMAQVFELAKAQSLVLEQTESDGSVSKRMQTAVFRIV